MDENEQDRVQSDDDGEPPAWRYGPSQIWYDRMNVPPNPKHFDYGIKTLQKRFQAPSKLQNRNLFGAPSQDEESGYEPAEKLSEKSFLPVNLVRWEDDIIFDVEDAKETFLKDYSSGKLPYCGWIALKNARTYNSFMKLYRRYAPKDWFKAEPMKDAQEEKSSYPVDPHHSMFPVDNYDLEHTNWEEDIIWDLTELKKPLEPKILTLDFEDDPKIFGLPDDIPLDEVDSEDVKSFERKDHQFTKKSKLILGQVQQRQKQEEQEQLENTMAQIADRDPFNLSNDDYYALKTTTRQNVVFSGGSVIQHSIPAQNIHRAFFPTCMGPTRLRHFHRMPMQRKILRSLPMDKYGFIDVMSLNKHMLDMAEVREKRKLSEAGLEVFPVRDIKDLSAKDGTLLLFEFSEEHPPLLNQPGMANKIRNYYKRQNNKDPDLELDFGETAFTHTFPFLGNLEPGESLQAIENNMFRAPIYQHTPKTTDYLLIKSGNSLILRKCPIPFVVGQECPLQEVPNPNSKKASIFVRDFLLAFIYRLFWASKDTPRRLKMDDIKAAFPHYAESSVRKRLKGCSDFKRLGPGTESNYWILKEDFRLPSKEEVLAMISPEMCCANYSMLAAEQRLKDAGYGEKYIFAGDIDEKNESDDEVTIEDEIKCAPWNTTRAFLAAQRGKCVLDQSGIADPTGCGAGYSYVRVSAKPQKEDIPQVPKRLVTGTNADLRKLPLKEAKEICKQYGVRDEEINALSRWEIIDVIRTLSTQAAKARSDLSGMARFARGNIRLNYADMQQKYKQYCQRIFDLQNKTLGNPVELSTDDDSSAEEDEDNEEMVARLENILTTALGKKTSPSSTVPRKLKKPINGGGGGSGKKVGEGDQKDFDELMKMIHGDKEDSQMSSGSPVSSVPPPPGPSTAATTTTSADKEPLPKALLNFAPGSDEMVVAQNLKISRKALEMLVSRDNKTKKLKIIRTFLDGDGREVVRSEIISNSQVVEAYVKVRTTKDEKFIREYSHKDEEYKEEKRKEKRRLQDQLRRIKRNEERQKQGIPPKKPTVPPKPKPQKESLLKMKCSACGGTGHMKTNKNCPLYGKTPPATSAFPTVRDMLGAHQLEDGNSRGEVTEVEGTKLRIKKAALNDKSFLKMKIPKLMLKQSKGSSQHPNERDLKAALSTADSGNHTDDGSSDERKADKIPRPKGRPPKIATLNRRKSTIEDSAVDYLSGPHKSVHRRRADPKVLMSTTLGEIYADLKSVPGSEALMFPVNAKKVPDYYKVITEPMDMQQIKQQKICLILLHKKIQLNESKLVELEKQINPLLHEDDLVGFSYILEEIVEACKNVPKSAAFHTKVDARKLPNYYDKIKNPMHFGMILQNIKDHKYFTVGQFRRDVEQIKINSEIYNGQMNPYTLKAKEVVDYVDRLIYQRRDQLSELETNIRGKKAAEGVPIIEEENFSLETIIQQKQSDFNESTGTLPPASPQYQISEYDAMSVGGDSDRPMTESIILGDDDETRAGFDDDSAGVLNDDLALSDEDDDDDDDDEMAPSQIVPYSDFDTEDDEATRDNFANLAASNMSAAGQLSTDLALSSSSESDDDIISAKRPRLDEDFETM
uniref:Bromo domain-containing protein n=1 Tax=Panagrolaimus superbus TaxID=310955 RepID=A0A914YEX7_9BILA